MRKRLAILISDSGTTMQKMIEACQSGEIPRDIACIISSTPTADGIKRARLLGIPDKDIILINPDDFRGNDKKVDSDSFGLKILKGLKDHGATIVTQNGWMPRTPKHVIDEYSKTMFNQHPGPVPEFGGPGMYGKRVHAVRLLFTRMVKRDYWTEAIAQRVRGDFDQGAVVKSRRVNIYPQDSVDDLQQRVLLAEHQVGRYPLN